MAKQAMGWIDLKRLLVRRGFSNDVVKVAFLAFVAGTKRGLYLYGETTFPCKGNAEAEWNEFYESACNDFNDAILDFDASAAKGGDS